MTLSTNCMNMKLLLILSLFGAVFGTDDISQYGAINYGMCQWLYGGSTDKVNCPAGYVGVGACGVRGSNACGPNKVAFGIECCKINSGGKVSHFNFKHISLSYYLLVMSEILIN